MSLKIDAKSKNLVFGNSEVLKKIKQGSVKKVYIASNAPKRDEIVKLCDLSKIQCEIVEEDNVKLGILCKKPFSVSVLGVE